MPVFDITNAIIRRDLTVPYDPYDRTPYANRQAATNIVKWLGKHVGEYYGRGDDEVMHIGMGWEMYIERQGSPDEDSTITYHVDITDEALATVFALTWIS
jgi:hypothetical protein